MFTGIVEEVGSIRTIELSPRLARLAIDASVPVLRVHIVHEMRAYDLLTLGVVDGAQRAAA